MEDGFVDDHEHKVRSVLGSLFAHEFIRIRAEPLACIGIQKDASGEKGNLVIAVVDTHELKSIVAWMRLAVKKLEQELEPQATGARRFTYGEDK